MKFGIGSLDCDTCANFCLDHALVSQARQVVATLTFLPRIAVLNLGQNQAQPNYMDPPGVFAPLGFIILKAQDIHAKRTVNSVPPPPIVNK
jgi:hypothetical protein